MLKTGGEFGGSLTRDFALKYLAVSLLIAFVQVSLDYQNVRTSELGWTFERFASIASAFRVHAETDPDFSLPEARVLAEREVRELEGLSSIFLVSPQGEVIAEAERNGGVDRTIAFASQVARAALARGFDEEKASDYDLDLHGRPARAQVVPLPSLGIAAVVIGDLAPTHEKIADALVAMVARRLAVLALLMTTIYILMRAWVLRPISDLAAAVARSRSTGHFEAPRNMPHNEIGGLAKLFGEVCGDLRRRTAETEMLAQVANATHAGVLIADGAGKVLWVNAGFAQMTGFSRKEIQGRTHKENYSSRGKPIGSLSALSQGVRFRHGYKVETLSYANDGREYWALIEVRPIMDDADEIRNFIVIETDITEAKDAEAALQRSQRQLKERVDEFQAVRNALEEERMKCAWMADELADAKEALELSKAAQVETALALGHELREPMNGVIGATELLMQEGLTSGQRTHVETIRDASDNILTVIDRLGETGTPPTAKEEVKQKTSTPAPARQQTEETPARPLSVLLAEDQPVNQKLMAAVMERLGHRLVIANNGVEALRLLETDRFDLILMDIQMPELDGINATKVIRSSDAPWRDIPIVAVTAHASAGQREVYLSAGMDGFVAKPFKIDILIAEMTRVTNGASTGSEEQQHDAEIVELPSPDGKMDKALAAMLDELDSLTG